MDEQQLFGVLQSANIQCIPKDPKPFIQVVKYPPCSAAWLVVSISLQIPILGSSTDDAVMQSMQGCALKNSSETQQSMHRIEGLTLSPLYTISEPSWQSMTLNDSKVNHGDSFAAKVAAHGKKLFIVCVIFHLPMSFLWRLMENAKFDDTHLPLNQKNLPPEWKIDSDYYDMLLYYQLTLLPPFFQAGVYDRKISSASNVAIKQVRDYATIKTGSIDVVSIDKESF